MKPHCIEGSWYALFTGHAGLKSRPPASARLSAQTDICCFRQAGPLILTTMNQMTFMLNLDFDFHFLTIDLDDSLWPCPQSKVRGNKHWPLILKESMFDLSLCATNETKVNDDSKYLGKGKHLQVREHYEWTDKCYQIFYLPISMQSYTMKNDIHLCAWMRYF